MHTREAKMCACMLKRAHMHLYASCAHDFTRNCTKIVCHDSKFKIGDICKITLNMHVRGIIEHAKFQHLRLHIFALCARVCALIFTIFFCSSLLCYKLKFQIS